MAGKDVPDDAKVFETVATGYTFQGQMLRPALVLLDPPKGPLPAQPPVATAPPTNEPTEEASAS
jgi:hypothetical protein